MNQERRHLTEQFEKLKERLLTMGGLAEARLHLTMRALLERNLESLAAILVGDSGIGGLQSEIDDRCFTLIALHQPVAVDLRTVISSLKISADLARVADGTINIAEIAQRYLLHPPVKPLIDLPRMGELALKMLREALDAFVSRDISLAQSVLRQDDWLDALKQQIFRELLTYMLGDSQTIEPGIDLILMSRHLVRIGDHATNIAEDVIFIVEGRDVRHRSSSRRQLTDGAVAMGMTIERRKIYGSEPV